MRKFRIIFVAVGLLLGICTAMAQCSGCCTANQILRYDSITGYLKCYILPYVSQGRLYPILGSIEATTVEYDTMIIRDWDNFVDIDTLTNIGTYNQANDALKIDCSTINGGKMESGTYLIITIANIITDTTPPFDCFPLYNSRNSSILKYTKKCDTRLKDVSPQPLFELVSNVAQNRLEIVWNDGFGPSHGFVYNVLGQIQESFTAPMPIDAIDVSRLSNGFYILSVQTKKGRHSAWFRVQR